MRLKKIFYPLAMAFLLAACANGSKDKETKEEVKSNQVSQAEDQKDAKDDQSDDNEIDVDLDNSEELPKLDKTYYEYFDTVTTILTYSKDKKSFDKHCKLLEKELDRYNKLYNSYDSFDGVNNFKTINDKAGIEPVKVDPEIIELIEYSEKIYDLTGGTINIAMGSLLGLWHQYREMSIDHPEKAAIPSEKELTEKANHKDINSIVIDKKNSTVYIKDPDVQIDIGAIGKGFATEKIANKLKKAGFTKGIISVGGDDVIIGDNPNNSQGLWKIAVQNPFLDQKDKPYSSIVSVKNTSVVTSGDYQRFFTVNGKNYHHIIDPATRYPSTRWKSVSVQADSISLADSLSTYFFIIDHETGLKKARENKVEAYWIDPEGNEFKTDGWKAMEDE